MAAIRDRYVGFIARHEAAWEITFALLAVAYVAIGFAIDSSAQPSEFLHGVDWMLTALFAAEFFTRLAASRDRVTHIRSHWIDAIALVPAVRGVRILRLVRLVRAFAGMGRVLARAERLAQHQGLAWLLVTWLGVAVLCSIALYAAENGTNAAVRDPVDALWWGIVTMTTVGYGDVTPITGEGRLAAAVLMLLGIGLFSAVTAAVTSFFVAERPNPLDELARLGDLRDRELVTAEEFSRKRAALARRL